MLKRFCFKELATDVSSFSYHYEDIFPWKDGFEHASKLQEMLIKYTSSVTLPVSIPPNKASSSSLFISNATTSTNKPPTTSTSTTQDPIQLKVKNLFTKVQTILKSASTIAQQQQQPQQSSDVTNSNTAKQGQDISSIATRWKYAFEELIALPESRLTMELLNVFYQVLVQSQFFYGMYLGDDQVHQHPVSKEIQYPKEWNKFEVLQGLISDFCTLYETIQARQEQGDSKTVDSNDVMMEVDA
jgi:hypothetical protein